MSRHPPVARSKWTAITREIGNDKFNAKDYSVAIEYYTFALGSIMEARGALPDLLQREGEEAARASETLDEMCARALNNRSLSLTRMKRHAEALEDAEECVAAWPIWAKAYYRQGMCLAKLKQYAEACEAFRRANGSHSESFARK